MYLLLLCPMFRSFLSGGGGSDKLINYEIHSHIYTKTRILGKIVGIFEYFKFETEVLNLDVIRIFYFHQNLPRKISQTTILS